MLYGFLKDDFMQLQFSFDHMSEIRIRIQNSLKRQTRKKKKLLHLDQIIERKQSKIFVDERQMTIFDFMPQKIERVA
jgi:hypothetical protein